jgi:hypothetical protein
MKKMINSLALIFLLNLGAGAQKYCIKNLVGYWASSEGAGIEVIDSTKIFLVYGIDKKSIVSYTTDFTKTPCWFDFTIKDSTQTITIKSLMLFVNEDLVQWQIFEDVRPDNFSKENGTMVYLKRKK